MVHTAGHTDQELLSLLTQGDKRAFDFLYERYAQVMFFSAYKRLKDQERCKDIVQDIWTDLWSRKADVHIENIRAYLLSAVRFQVLKLIEKEMAPANFFKFFQQLPPVTGTAADGSVMEKELSAFFRSWLDALPPKRREIFTLYYANKLTVAEIADQLQIAPKTVQNQLGIATADLRSRLTSFLLLLA